jgi:hypothetical protein
MLGVYVGFYLILGRPYQLLPREVEQLGLKKQYQYQFYLQKKLLKGIDQ